jgi:hypothetical protein
MKRTALILTALFGLGLLLTGCPNTPDPPHEKEGGESSLPPSQINPGGSNDPCDTDADCNKEGEFCFTAVSLCKDACETDEDCGEGGLCDPEAGLCVTCLDDDDCALGVCHPSTRSCVQCAEDTDCLVGVCDVRVSYCVQCLENSDCLSDVCHSTKETCVECLLDSHCDDDDSCTIDSCAEERCRHIEKTNTIGCLGVECLSDSDCPSTDSGCGICVDQVCDLVWEQACNDDADCDDENPCTSNTCSSTACGTLCVQTTTTPGCVPCQEEGDCPDLPGTCLKSCSENICSWTGLGEPGCECTTPFDCDDGNACTQENCSEGICSNESLSGTECSSDDPCAIGAICDLGLCVALGISAQCDIPCTADLECPLNSIGCTGGCKEGHCAYPPLAGKCPECQAATDCEDGNSCTDDVCILGICIVSTSPAGAACDDGDPCTELDSCVAGTCVSLSPSSCPVECETDDDCKADSELAPNDTDFTLLEQTCAAACVDNVCLYEDFKNECAEGCKLENACFSGAKCVSSGCGQICQFQYKEDCATCDTDDLCDDGNPCTSDKCNDGVCEHESTEADVCEEGNACNAPSVCTDGVCVPGVDIVNCDDNNPCTVDACDVIDGACQFTAGGDGVTCDDGDKCTQNDACLLGTCTGEKEPSCEAACPAGPGSICDPNVDGCEPGLQCTCVSVFPNSSECILHWCLSKTLSNAPYACDDGGCKGETETCSCLEGADIPIEDCEIPTCLAESPCQTCTDETNCEGVFPGACATQCDAGLCVPTLKKDECATDIDCPNGGGCVLSACGKKCGGSAESCPVEAGQEYPCDDQNPCTHDSCVEDIGCQNDPFVNDTPCPFTQATGGTAEGVCEDGICTAITAPEFP